MGAGMQAPMMYSYAHGAMPMVPPHPDGRAGPMYGGHMGPVPNGMMESHMIYIPAENMGMMPYYAPMHPGMVPLAPMGYDSMPGTALPLLVHHHLSETACSGILCGPAGAMHAGDPGMMPAAAAGPMAHMNDHMMANGYMTGYGGMAPPGQRAQSAGRSGHMGQHTALPQR